MKLTSKLFRAIAIGIITTVVSAGTWCDEPYPPEHIFGPEAQEFRKQIVEEFETYMVEARDYINCLELERQRVFEEVRVQANVYGDFLNRIQRETP